MSAWSSPDLVRAALNADDEMQVGLRAAVEFLESKRIPEYERCMLKVNSAIENEKLLLLEENFPDKKQLDLIESDVQWKECMIRDLPIPVSPDQIKAILTLVKSRPFLASLGK